MSLTSPCNTRSICRNCWSGPFRIVLLLTVSFSAWAIGCNNTCFSFTSNSPTGIVTIKVSDLSPTCTLTRVKGAVHVQLATEAACSSCPASVQVQHIILSIRSIDVHPSEAADGDSPDWQELLAPERVRQPLNIVLTNGAADRSVREPFGDIMTIPAGVYRQVRLRFVPNEPATEDRLPGLSACGGVWSNCVVMADGRVLPLQLGRSSPELRMTPDKIEGGSLVILPDTDTNVVIELKPSWALFSPADQGVRVLPALAGKAKAGPAGVE
jgi:hypothetical protein